MLSCCQWQSCCWHTADAVPLHRCPLQGHLKNFKDEVQELNTKILQAALALHDKVSTTFRKTAVNFHYEFTVRHLANVFQGLLMSSPEQFNSTTKWGKLWLHESERVYADRLVSAPPSAR